MGVRAFVIGLSQISSFFSFHWLNVKDLTLVRVLHENQIVTCVENVNTS